MLLHYTHWPPVPGDVTDLPKPDANPQKPAMRDDVGIVLSILCGKIFRENRRERKEILAFRAVFGYNKLIHY